jgi:cysteine desulfurase/selenocysteine lyase
MSAGHATAVASGFDVEACRRQFPILERVIRGQRLAYLDTAASAQKPRPVIAAMQHFLEHSNANVHRGVHLLAEEATDAYEQARSVVARFLGAASADEVVFVRGTTEGLNLAARVLAAPRLEPGDEILVSRLEHHSNLVPWQLVAAERGARLRVAELDARGDLDLDSFDAALSPRTKIVAMAHVSNALGTVMPIAEVARRAHAAGAIVVVDGAQAVAHRPVDVSQLGCDAYCFSGHKLYGPMGIGAMWARGELLAEAPPWQGGGSMIRRVSITSSTFADPPQRFEAGTPNVAGAVGLAAAIEWFSALDRNAAWSHERRLLERARAELAAIPGLRLIGEPREREAVCPFVVDGVHPHDLASLLDAEGIAIRAGHHCTQPLLEVLGLAATARASFAVHSTDEEVDRLVGAVDRARRRFSA